MPNEGVRREEGCVFISGSSCKPLKRASNLFKSQSGTHHEVVADKIPFEGGASGREGKRGAYTINKGPY